MFRAILRGAAAGAVGTTALDAVTYLDMAVRGRPASDVPQRTLEALARRVGARVPGEGETRANRLTGLGALAGIATGMGVGAVLGLARRYGWRPPLLLGAVLAGAAAMAASDVPVAGLGVSDPRTWSATAWVSDVVPHLTYGVATTAVLDAAYAPPSVTTLNRSTGTRG